MRSLPVHARVHLALFSVLVLLVPVALTVGTEPARAADVVRNPARPSSTVSLRTGSQGRAWSGSMTIAFTNVDVDPLSRIYLRLWSNGVQGCEPLAIRVSDMVGGSRGELAQRCTTLPVDLDVALGQGERGSIAFDLEIRLPRRNDRFGYLRGLALLGSALPALAVHDDAGWNLPPFFDLGESFYSVAGRYEVTLDTPSGLATPTTGATVDRQVLGDRTIATYVARRVRDFEWAAGKLGHLLGHSRGVRVRVWYQPGVTSRRRAASMLDVAERSMATFIDAFGPYPYPEVDVVLTGYASFGGMEYPTIVFANPDRATVTHELAHQWWYGLVGNDQFSEPWLDEGFATWSEDLPDRPRRACGDFRWPSAEARMTNDMAYWRDHPFEYGRVVYVGGGCLLAQLVDELGLARFLRTLERYADTHRYGIARTEDFAALIDHVADRHRPGFDTAAFWARWRVDLPG